MFPLLLNGKDFHESTSDQVLRKIVSRNIKVQYANLDIAAYEQFDQSQKILLIDDIEKSEFKRGALHEAVEYFRKFFHRVVLFTSEDFFFDATANNVSAAALNDSRRLKICEFGHLRLDALARKWLNSTVANNQDVKTDDANRICKIIEQTLKTNAIPHHPWILLVLLMQVDSVDQPAAKNGSYGHLYNAVITAALARSKNQRIDIKTKYTYLAHFAHRLFTKHAPSLDEDEMRSFHDAHCAQFDVRLEFKDTRDDLVQTGVLRIDGGNVAFGAKYSFCFFLAWYFSRLVHLDSVRATIHELSTRLYHEESANTMVFLAHLCSDPIVLKEMRRAASELFATVKPANLDTDVTFLDELEPQHLRLALPESEPEDNRRQQREEKDEASVKAEPRIYDGRSISTHPESDISKYDESLKMLMDMRAARKTIEILGQVLRNEVGAIEGRERIK